MQRRHALWTAGVFTAAILPLTAIASSHREAPFITNRPKVDGTDLYLFNSYEAGRAGYVTMIANYQPFEAPTIEGAAAMTFKQLLLLAAASAAVMVVGCSSSDRPGSSSPTMPPVTQTLDTAQVLALAQNRSENSEPFQVDYGLISIGESNETSSPIAVNGN